MFLQTGTHSHSHSKRIEDYKSLEARPAIPSCRNPSWAPQTCDYSSNLQPYDFSLFLELT